jgi:hypothetical protein
MYVYEDAHILIIVPHFRIPMYILLYTKKIDLVIFHSAGAVAHNRSTGSRKC